MSKVYQLSSSWKDFSSLRTVFIFGDSYSDVGFSLRTRAIPTASRPLGIQYPGFTFCAPDPNWVGHLITKYCPPPRYDPHADVQDPAYLESPLLVYDFAIGGSTVSKLRHQFETQYLPMIQADPDLASQDPLNKLFISWVGINDCAYSSDHTNSHKALFSFQEELYEAGARNFLFIDVPPIYRSPAVAKNKEEETAPLHKGWNTGLHSQIEQFCRSHPEASVFLFSAYQLFSDFLDNPGKYGLNPQDVRKMGGDVWIDHLHPSAKVHEIIASNLATFMDQVA